MFADHYDDLCDGRRGYRDGAGHDRRRLREGRPRRRPGDGQAGRGRSAARPTHRSVRAGLAEHRVFATCHGIDPDPAKRSATAWTPTCARSTGSSTSSPATTSPSRSTRSWELDDAHLTRRVLGGRLADAQGARRRRPRQHRQRRRGLGRRRRDQLPRVRRTPRQRAPRRVRDPAGHPVRPRTARRPVGVALQAVRRPARERRSTTSRSAPPRWPPAGGAASARPSPRRSARRRWSRSTARTRS